MPQTAAAEYDEYDEYDELPATLEDAGVVALNAARLEHRHDENDLIEPADEQLNRLQFFLSDLDSHAAAPTPDVPRCKAVGCAIRYERLGARIGVAERVHKWWYGYEGRCLASVIGLNVPNDGWCREDPADAAAAAREQDAVDAAKAAADEAEGVAVNGGGDAPAATSTAGQRRRKRGKKGTPTAAEAEVEVEEEEDEDYTLSPEERQRQKESIAKEAARLQKEVELEQERERMIQEQANRAVACIQCMSSTEKLMTGTAEDHSRQLRQGSWSRLVSDLMVERFRQSRENFPWPRVVSLLRSGDGALQRVTMRALFHIAGLESPEAAAAARKKAKARGGWGAARKAVDLKRLRRSSTTGTAWQPGDPDLVARYAAMELVHLTPLTSAVGTDAEALIQALAQGADSTAVVLLQAGALPLARRLAQDTLASQPAACDKMLVELLETSPKIVTKLSESVLSVDPYSWPRVDNAKWSLLTLSFIAKTPTELRHCIRHGLELLVKALLRSPDSTQRHFGVDSMDSIIPHGKNRTPAPLVIPTDIQWAIEVGRDSVETQLLRESCLKNLGYDAMHKFLLRQLGPRLKETLFEPLSAPGSVVARYTDRWPELDMIESDAEVAEWVFAVVAEHIDDEYGYIMTQQFIRLLPRALRLCMASDDKLTSGLLLFVAANATVVQLPAVVEALQIAAKKLKKVELDLDGLANLIESKMLRNLRKCIADVPLSAPVAEAVMDRALGRVALKTFVTMADTAGKVAATTSRFKTYNKNAKSEVSKAVGDWLAGTSK